MLCTGIGLVYHIGLEGSVVLDLIRTPEMAKVPGACLFSLCKFAPSHVSLPAVLFLLMSIAHGVLLSVTLPLQISGDNLGTSSDRQDQFLGSTISWRESFRPGHSQIRKPRSHVLPARLRPSHNFGAQYAWQTWRKPRFILPHQFALAVWISFLSCQAPHSSTVTLA